MILPGNAAIPGFLRVSRVLVLALIALPFAPAFAAIGPGALRTAEDLNPDPRILEVRISAREAVVDLTGTA